MSVELPIACDLTDPERRKREDEIREFLTGAAESVTERANGIDVRFAGEADADCLGEIAELMTIERTCCRFLRFALTAEPDRGPIRLAITGPQGTREFLKSWHA